MRDGARVTAPRSSAHARVMKTITTIGVLVAIGLAGVTACGGRYRQSRLGRRSGRQRKRIRRGRGLPPVAAVRAPPVAAARVPLAAERAAAHRRPEYAVLVRGTLFTTDLVEAKTYHDGLAAGGEQPAKDAGDFGHDALLGTTLLGSTENAFLGIDRWDNLAGLQGFYANPDFQKNFGMLFSAPPTVETFEHQPTWHGWGDLTSGDSSDPYWFVVVRGHLAEADAAKAQTGHDGVAAAGEAAAKAAGDVAHVVFTGVEDAQEFMAVDIWPDSTNLEALYTNPDFQMAFGSLFDAPPVIAVYKSTDWHQW